MSGKEEHIAVCPVRPLNLVCFPVLECMSVCVYWYLVRSFCLVYRTPRSALLSRRRTAVASQDLLFFQRTLCTRACCAHLVCKASIRRSDPAAEEGGSEREKGRESLSPLASSDVGDKPGWLPSVGPLRGLHGSHVRARIRK